MYIYIYIYLYIYIYIYLCFALLGQKTCRDFCHLLGASACDLKASRVVVFPAGALPLMKSHASQAKAYSHANSDRYSCMSAQPTTDNIPQSLCRLIPCTVFTQSERPLYKLTGLPAQALITSHCGLVSVLSLRSASQLVPQAT